MNWIVASQGLSPETGISAAKVKVALNGLQVEELGLPPQMKAKRTSSRRAKFVSRHGEDVFELEAVRPAQLQAFLREAIESVMDVELFNAEVEKEKQDAAHLDEVRQRTHALLGQMRDLESD
jgi:hypothetical protein